MLVAGGSNGAYLASAEVYDPGADTWTAVASLTTAHDFFTATLLPSGKVLVAGGYADSAIAGAEVFDRELEFEDAWRPGLNRIAAPLTPGQSLSLTGSGFRGYKHTEASGGGTNNSATNYPLVQIRRLDNEQWVWASPSDFSDTAYTSLPVTNLLAGPAIVTVFVNGIPSVSQSSVSVNHRVFLPMIVR